jgi:hypothetical protein
MPPNATTSASAESSGTEPSISNPMAGAFTFQQQQSFDSTSPRAADQLSEHHGGDSGILVILA